MTTELTMLALSVALLLILIVVQASVGVRAKGLAPLAGSRDEVDPATGFHARMLRVVDNHREGLTVFAPLILIAAASGISTPMTVLGSQLFFASRLVHAGLYVLGVPMIRPLVWAVGLTGIVMILLALFHLA